MHSSFQVSQLVTIAIQYLSSSPFYICYISVSAPSWEHIRFSFRKISAACGLCSFLHQFSLPLLPNPRMVAFPCGVCKRSVASNHRAFQCDICNSWIHIKCNYLDKKSYAFLKNPINEGEMFICLC